MSWPLRLALALPAIVALVVVAVVLGLSGGGESGADAATRRATIVLGGSRLEVEVADTQAARRRGLAGRSALRRDHGMLFRWPREERRAVWMKGMRFGVDVVWIRNGRVTGTEHGLPVPAGDEDFLPTYPSPGPVDGFLEVRSGWAAEHRVRRAMRVRVEAWR